VKVCVIGGTGFTGKRVVKLLREERVATRCLVRPTSNWSAEGVETVTGSLEDRDSLLRALTGVDTLLMIASLGFGHAPNLLEAALQAGVSRAVFVSTTSIFTQLNPASKSVRLAAEKAIAESGLRYTILRPTMIYGTRDDRNMARLIRFIGRSPIVPVAGSGQYLQQPVYVDDVARAVLLAAANERTVGGAYNIPGATAVTFDEVVDTIARKLGRRVRKVHLPLWPVVRTLRATESLGLRLPLKSEQFLRLNEHKTFDVGPARDAFGYAPISFAQGIEREIRDLQDAAAQ
jgi:nucleoside-diphosphate-sugar epimerase